MNVPTIMPTPGPWIANTRNLKLNGHPWNNVITVEKSDNLGGCYVIAICGETDTKNASEAFANAALISISRDMLETLVSIQELAISAMDGDLNGVLDARPVVAMISDIFEKLANEAGVQ